MDEKVSVPYIVYEGEQTRMERHTKRLVIALIISILLIFASNALWIWAWLQYDYVGEEVTTTTTTHTVDVDAKDGIANYIGNDGDIVNGKDSGYDYCYNSEAQDESAEESE